MLNFIVIVHWFELHDGVSYWPFLFINSLKRHEIRETSIECLKKRMIQIWLTLLLFFIRNNNLVYHFEWIAWTLNVTIASNICSLLKIHHENEPHLLHIDRIQVPIALAKLFIQIVELLSNHLTEFTIKQQLQQWPKYQTEWCNQIDQIRVLLWLFFEQADIWLDFNVEQLLFTIFINSILN